MFLRENPPDLVITFDYPDFHLRLMRKMGELKLAPHALKICAIPPKVWVWRAHRVEQIRRLYDGVLVVFPFEKNFYEKRGIPVIYEGNPLIAELLEGGHAEPKLTTESETFQITVMPGSRDAELKYHLPLISPTLELFSIKLKQKVKALVPVPRGIDLNKIKSILINSANVEYEFKIDGAKESLSNTTLGLIKSGTATLESVVLGCVPVIFYKTNKLTEWLLKLFVRYQGPVGLPNILLQTRLRSESPFPEFLGRDATPLKLADELFRLASQTKERAIAQRGLAKLTRELVPTDSVGLQIAKKIRYWQIQKPVPFPARKGKVLIGLISFCWSTVNYLRREYFYGLPEQFLVPSILFGNIQAGGSGKTPILIEFAKAAIQRGLRVGVVTRGYRGKSEKSNKVISPEVNFFSAQEFGDEPAEIKKCLPSVYLAVGRDRCKSVRLLLEKAKENQDKIDLLLFDDGFQNLKFEAVVNVICVTDQQRAQIAFRDFASALDDADFILGTKGNDFSEYELAFPRQFYRVNWEPLDLPVIPIWLLTAVGQPEEVIHFYSSRGVKIQRTILKRDHAEFDPAEVKKLMEEAFSQGCMLAMTEKDYVKLAPLKEAMSGSEVISAVNAAFSTVTVPLPDQVFVLKRKLNSPEVIKKIFDYLQP